LILRRQVTYSSMGEVCPWNWRLEKTGVMLWLIDGYNLMHAAGAIDKHAKNGRTFHRKRRQFLDVLAGALGVDRASRTTIVFDAKKPPADFPVEATYQGMSIIFALGDENADARIERLIAAHSAPKSLTVVSTDRRVRQAANRRKATSLTSEEFLDAMDRFQRQESRPLTAPVPAPAPDRPAAAAADQPSSAASNDADYWVSVFGHLDSTPEVVEALAPSPTLLTDEEIARIQREVDQES
jgi:predicted RNA-binding protein with PIN domain